MDLIDSGAAVLELPGGTGNERRQQRLAGAHRILVDRLLREAGPGLRDGPLSEPEVADTLPTDDVRHGFLALGTEQRTELLRRLEHVRVVAAAQPSVGGDDQDAGSLGVLPFHQQWMSQ